MVLMKGVCLHGKCIFWKAWLLGFICICVWGMHWHHLAGGYMSGRHEAGVALTQCHSYDIHSRRRCRGMIQLDTHGHIMLLFYALMMGLCLS